MQELKKKRRKRPKNELDRGAQKEQKNLTDITEEQLKVNIGIVRLGNMIKVIQIVMKVLLCMLAVLFSFLAILLHEAANWMLATQPPAQPDRDRRIEWCAHRHAEATAEPLAYLCQLELPTPGFGDRCSTN